MHTKTLVTTFVLFFFSVDVYAQITAKQAVSEMTRGINIGNTFDAPGGETAWGNPKVEEYYFDDYKDVGINTVRIPVTWNEHTGHTNPWTIDQTFLSRVEQVVDWGLARGLYIIINAHHEGWIKNPSECVDGQCGFTQANFDRLNGIWTQVADRFKDKSYRLLFEILNEPEQMTLDHLNQVNSRITKTIRSSGGNNAKRIIVVAGTEWSAFDKLFEITLPESDHTFLIGNFHCYSPWSFVSDETGNARWGSDQDKNDVRNIFTSVRDWSNRNNIAVSYNEWGAGFASHEYQSIMEFYQWYGKMTVEYGVSAVVWDDGGMFQTYVRKQRQWVGDLIDSISQPILSKNGVKAVGYYDSHNVKRVQSSSGNYVGNINTGSWISFRVQKPKTSQYNLDIQVASTSTGGILAVLAEGDTKTYATIQIPSTGGFEIWQTVNAKVNLNQGIENIVFKSLNGGYNIKTLKLTVIDGPPVNVTGVTVNPSTGQVGVNQQFQFKAYVIPADATNQEVSWSTANSAIATVDSYGAVTGKSIGTTTILATTVEGAFTSSATITVTEVQVTGIQLSPASAQISRTGTITLTVTIIPSEASDKAFTLTSSNPSVALVDANGVVSAVNGGSATITATSHQGGFTATSEIKVTSCPEWQRRVNYPIGTVVLYQGQTYTSTNDWTGGAPDPYTATHTQTGWGWAIGGVCNEQIQQ